MLPVERVEECQTADEALLILHLKRVKMRVELIESFSDVGRPVRVGAGEAERGILLVGVEEAFQTDAMVPYIGDIEQRVLGERALDGEEIALDVGSFGVLWDVGDVVGCFIEAGDKARGE